MTKEHGASSRRQALLYDPEIPTPTHAERARTLVGSERLGTLCTLAADLPGHPYGSLVSFALDGGRPVFLLSDLAAHTRNLKGDQRASLLVAEAGEGNPLALGRVTLVGTCAPLEGEAAASAREAFLAAHPDAKFYADFSDFGFWGLEVQQVRYIGGFGRMSWVEPGDWVGAEPDPMAPHAAGIITHMNEDHAEALVACCLAFSLADEVASASMTGIDRYGFEMSAETPSGRRPIRVAFERPIHTPKEAREALVALVRRARQQLSEQQDKQ